MPRAGRTSLVLSVLAAVALLVLPGVGACGGSVILVDGGPASGGSGEDSGSTSSSSSSSSGSGTGTASGGPGTGGSASGGTVFAVCPASMPSAGDPCAPPGQGCAYVTYNGCQAIACDATGHWQFSPTGC